LAVKGTTTRPLDGGASTSRWARAPARGLAAALPPTPPPIGHWATAAPLSAARERKEEGKKIEGGAAAGITPGGVFLTGEDGSPDRHRRQPRLPRLSREACEREGERRK